MRKLLQASLLAALAGISAPATQAADNVVLVELFTSQGCSSCPPADRNLAALAKREDVLALSMHVDYWDYLGWRDTFASTAHTERQYEYRRLMGARVVYTPQMIIQGREDVPGYKPDMIAEAISKSAAVPRAAGIAIADVDGMYEAVITGTASTPEQTCTIWVASYAQESPVEIERGENAGRTITYHNVVEKLMKVGPWDTDAPQTINLPQPAAGEGVAVWLQDDATGEVISASFIEN